ncbi:MAG TPA: CRTAC1 family protein [Gemmataceae bacterium]|nr:CRTAC1 family protein [Gemmataceae bacterium]
MTEELGLDFVHDIGPMPPEKYFMPQMVGSGVAVFDFDNDGRMDLYFVQNGGPNSKSTNRLFRQTADGHFVDVSKGSGLDITGYGMGVAIGDVNNDGWPDVLVTEYGRVRLFLNNGNGTFTDVTKEAGLENPLWATSAAFVDYDRDGWLDLVIVNYVDYVADRKCPGRDGTPDFCGPSAFDGRVTKLYHNRGRSAGSSSNVVRFDDVTVASGLGRLTGPGLGVICADFNGDHWPDILIANDGKPNHLWINQRNGTFKEEALLRGVAYNAMGQAEANMGIALGDVDGDGLFDLFVTHLGDEKHRLWKQGPRGQFRDQTAAAGLANPKWNGTGFGAVLVDFDHDGTLDLALVNGRVRRDKDSRPDPATIQALGPFWAQYADRNQLFTNEGGGHFRDLSPANPVFCGTPAIGRGLAYGDLHGDGAIDLVATYVGGPARIYRNVAPKRGHWLMVRALDPALHRDAYGAEITLEAGGRRWWGMISPGSSYLCSNDPRAHFGLGPVDRLEALTIIWPDGSEETYPGGPVDRLMVARKGEGRHER